ncbi:YnfA family protein [Geodermatophilus sp. FMUSA9-8]|uniref:YnfA family protein n=1 Tax=Geodermatophilus sp. FMUSA9-8 TaxID=3120155 RepID=UPI003FA530FD
MTVARSALLFLLAAVAEIGGAWLVWQGVREHRGWLWTGFGVIALGLYGFVATLQRCELRPDPRRVRRRVRRRLAGLGHGRRRVPADRYDITGALIRLVGVAVIMYAPRSA